MSCISPQRLKTPACSPAAIEPAATPAEVNPTADSTTGAAATAPAPAATATPALAIVRHGIQDSKMKRIKNM
ncbi:hypothetical protein DPMN_101577 [Dreissena polymorpha]|uniref:Uncharacterized protein n=1 Tax=Dreissena polymorpha TaxID=45954 RepID=A0A9D4R9U9_DREPO|nr:hypothetical protein DPMN_101577 [Dreissena polymorpha]